MYADYFRRPHRKLAGSGMFGEKVEIQVFRVSVYIVAAINDRYERYHKGRIHRYMYTFHMRT